VIRTNRTGAVLFLGRFETPAAGRLEGRMNLPNRPRLVLLIVPLLAACARPDAASQPDADSGVVPAGARMAPTGARIEASGFATVERAPPRPYPDEPPPAEDRPQSEAGWYARDLGISEEEAARRQREQHALQPEMERLLGTLRQREADNFTAVRMVHEPDWAYDFYFKHDPERTLARYTSNPRFRAAEARYTRDELEALIRPWTERFTRHRLTSGWGVDDTYGRAEIMMDVTEEAYREIAAREGWGPVPEAVELKFASPVRHPPIEVGARPFVRLLAQNDRGTGIQLTAAGFGRVVLRDGCLFVQRAQGQDQLAYFHRETGLGIDEEGYLVLRNRMTGESQGRVGEWFVWAGPNAIDEEMPMAAELRSRCGSDPIVNIGNPESAYQSRVRVWQIDDLARQRRISRRQAWEMLKRCWVRNDEAQPDRSPSADCNF
jgi:hypothetical protein